VAILSLNGCPRCQGDIVLGNEDQYGWYEQCLQCGYIHDLQTIVQVEPQSVQIRKKTRIGGPKRKVLGRYSSPHNSSGLFHPTGTSRTL
jgi:hypothetical protein